MATEFSKCPHCGGADKDRCDVYVNGLEVRVSYVCEDCGEAYDRVYEWVRNDKSRG